MFAAESKISSFPACCEQESHAGSRYPNLVHTLMFLAHVDEVRIYWTINRAPRADWITARNSVALLNRSTAKANRRPDCDSCCVVRRNAALIRGCRHLGGGEFLRQQNAYERTAQAPGPSIAGRHRLLRLLGLPIRKASPHRQAIRARPDQMESFDR